MYTIDNQKFICGLQKINQILELELDNSEIVILKKQDTVTITYKNVSDFYRLLVLALKSTLNTYEENTTQERQLTYMLDCSRNAVLSVSGAERLIAHLCVLGYQELSLYTEDTYEVKDEPCFGYLRGRFSAEEIREIVDFAGMFGIEVTLSIQCLAHMRSIYRYETYYTDAFDCNDVLMVGSNRVKKLMEHIFESIVDMLPSKTVNIGMDESFMLGRGKHLDKHGYVEQGELFFEQLKLVVEIAEKHDIRMRMWGDFAGSHYKNREEILSYVKEHNIQILFWNYGGPAEGKRTVEDLIREMEEGYFKNRNTDYPNCCFCISDHKIFGLAPHINLALHINEAYLEAAFRSGIQNIWLTSWGDCGAEVSPFASLPVMTYVGYATMFNCNMIAFREFFDSLFLSLDAFLMLDYANCLQKKLDLSCNTSSKYFLYQDVFMGVMDKSVRQEYGACYMKHIEEMISARQNISQRYHYLFDTQIKLLEVLSLKYNLGNQTKEAFASDNKERLSELIPIYEDVIVRIRDFFDAFQAQWYYDNKVFGFEIHEARIGALLFRIENCLKRLKKYCMNEIETLPELEEEILDLFGNEDGIIMLNWGELISPGVMIEYFSYV